MTDLFKPCYLYIKRHSITGLCYFGKTARHPEKYYGSGAYWKSHILKHGKNHVETLWFCLFVDAETIIDFALSFSKLHNIAESDDWANLIEEDGRNCYPGIHGKEKSTRTLISRYGVDNPGKLEKSKASAKKRMLSSANPCYRQTTSTIEKIKATSKENNARLSKEERSIKYKSLGFLGKKHSAESMAQGNAKISANWKNNPRVWMHNFLGKNFRVLVSNINEAYAQGCLKGYAPGTHKTNWPKN
jgi:hypothetical protein